MTNEEGMIILDFTLAYDLAIGNIFKKRDEYIITYKGRSHKTQIDYFSIRKIECVDCKYCKVIPRKSVSTQHRLLVLDIK